MKLFSILDVKAGFFMNPFSEPSTVQAIRSFDVGSNDPKSTFNRFPDDFALMEIGSFDPQSGEFKSHPSPINICTARSLIKIDAVPQNSLPFSQ